MNEWILVWTFFCLSEKDPNCRYMHKSYETFGECVEVLAERDHDMMDIPHIIFCTKRDYFIELRMKDDKYRYNAPKRNFTIE